MSKDLVNFTVRTARNGSSLVDFLAEELGLSKRKAKGLLDARNVHVNHKRVWMAQHTLAAGDIVEVQQVQKSGGEAEILWQDKDYLVANKPAGILSNGPDSLEAQLKKGLPDLQAVHRLDRDTTGCLIFAKSQEAFDAIVPLFREHGVTKIYKAIAAGLIGKKELTISQPLEGKSAETRVQVLASNKTASYISVKLITGRTHQVRKHLAHIGHPLAGERQYAGGGSGNERLRAVPRQMLHAEKLRFTSPVSGEEIHCNAPLPQDFRDCLRILGLNPPR
ncbi:MAG: pseudouridine synthase [Kiritimatiellia bacterium]